jgi:hypothetical protein
MQNKEKDKVSYFLFSVLWLKSIFQNGKKWTKRILLIFFNLILIVFILILLLMYSSAFQTSVAKIGASFLSEDIGLDISIKKVSIDIFHNVNLHELLIKDHKNDTMIYLDKLKVDVAYSSLFHKQLIIKKILLENPKIYAVRHKGDKQFNYEKLIEYFSSADTLKSKDTTKFDLQLKEIELQNAHLIYKDEKYNTQISEQMNFDYLNLHQTNLILTNIRQKKDTFYFQIKNFSAKEQCGFRLKKMRANVRTTPQSLYFKDLLFYTNKSVLAGDILLAFPSFSEFTDDPVKNMEIDGDLHSSTKIHFSDLYHFAKELKGWNEYVQTSGKIKGKVNDFSITDGYINYAGTEINGDIAIKGLPDIENTFFDIRAKSMITSAKCIERIPLYPFDKNEHIELPKQFDNTGIVNFKGTINGYYHQFKVNGILVTEIGDMKINAKLGIDNITNDLKYNGNFIFNRFHLGRFFKQKNIGTFTADVLLNGEGTIFKTMKSNIQANIKEFQFNNYTYRHIIADMNLDKKIFKGDLSASDENAQLTFTGQINFDNKIPDMNFILCLDNLNLNQLHLTNDKRNGILSGNIDIKVNGESIDDITGEINLNNIQYSTKERIYYFNHSKILLNQDNFHHKTFYFHSDFIDLDIQGKFKLSDGESYLNHFMQTFYPSFLKGKYNYHEIKNDTFQLGIKIKNLEPISDLFTNGKLFVQPNTYLKIHYHPKDLELVADFHSTLISYEKIKFINNQLQVNSAGQQLNSTLKIQKIILSDSLYLSDVSVCSHSWDNLARTNIEWQTFRDSLKYTYNGQIGFSSVFYPHAIYIIPDAFEIPVGKDKWTAEQLNPVVIDTAGNLDFFPLKFVRQNQSVTVQGRLHNNEKDELKISFNNFELHQINPLLSDVGTHLKGNLNGHLNWHQTTKKFLISSDIIISDFYLNNYFIGDIKTYTAYQPLNQSLFLRGNLSYNYSNILNDGLSGTKLKYLDFEGIYYINKKDSALDIDIEAKPFNLAILNPILKDIMTVDYAFLQGKGRITGTIQKPLISGNFKMTDSKIKTDFLYTYHKITGNIEVFPDQVRFEEMKIYNYGSKELAGFLNGHIFHNNFSNMRLDFDVSAKNLLVLNTNPLLNKDYYGKIYASGNIGIYGFLNDMNIEANLKPQKNSKFTLSFAHAEEVGENSFVKFVNPQDTLNKKETSKNIAGLQMNLILNATPDLETEVVFNDKTGDGVKARGEGVIEMNINSFGKFEMNGEYNIRSGTYLFTLESIINKKFEIENGSKITFIGNPYNTLIDINANYIQKASIAPLFPYDSSGVYKRRYPVTSKLTLRGKMIAPEILFSIEVPQLDAATQSKIQLILSDENELNRQFFSLLLLKSFVTPLQYTGAGGVSAGNALAANSSEMLSNRLNNALKGISNFVDVGVNYNPGSQTGSQQMELTMSKQMFNNRLSIDGSFGVNNNQAQNTSQIIGDVNIEYKLNESGKYILRAFNRTNNNTQMTISGGPYTQGIGVGYKYEFDSIFRRKNKKAKNIEQ